MELATHEVSLVNISALKNKLAETPDLVVFPLAIIMITIVVAHDPLPLLQSMNKLSFIPISVAWNKNSSSVHPVVFPVTIVYRTVLKQFFP